MLYLLRRLARLVLYDLVREAIRDERTADAQRVDAAWRRAGPKVQ